jgi:hypothetical protein
MGTPATHTPSLLGSFDFASVRWVGSHTIAIQIDGEWFAGTLTSIDGDGMRAALREAFATHYVERVLRQLAGPAR